MKTNEQTPSWLPPAQPTPPVELPDFLRPHPQLVVAADDWLAGNAGVAEQAEAGQPVATPEDTMAAEEAERAEESSGTEQSAPSKPPPAAEPTATAGQQDESDDAAEQALQELTAQLLEQKQSLQAQEQNLAESVSAVTNLLAGLVRQIPAVLVDTALAAAERILRRELERDPAWVLENARQCLERIGPNGPLRLRLHPRDVKLVTEQGSNELTTFGQLELVADPQLQRGDCLLESARARVDARLDRQLEALRPFLEDALAHWLEQGPREGEKP